MTSHSGFLTRSESLCGSRNCETSTSCAALISSGVRWSMNTGLPRQATVSRCPTCTGARSTSVVDSASVSRAGLSVSMNGQIVAARRPRRARRRSASGNRAGSRRHAPRWRAGAPYRPSKASSFRTIPSGARDKLPEAILLKKPNYATDCRINRQVGRHSYNAARPENPVPGRSYAPRLVRAGYPAETGALLRLAACFGVPVDLIEPCGFLFDDRRLRRALLDYAAGGEHSPPCLVERLPRRPRSALAARAADDRRRWWRCTVSPSPPTTRCCSAARAPACRIPCTGGGGAGRRYPLRPRARSLNVALAGAIALAEALRQTGLLPER